MVPALALLALLVQCADASSSLQPDENGLDSGGVATPKSGLPKTRGSMSDGEPRVFVIGPNKAGTTTLDELFLSMGRRSCHDTCPDKNGDKRARWDRTSHEKNASSPLWHLYNAFSDHGDHADYKWLDTAFPGSRFVLNTRAMQPWMLSSYDHVRVHREMYGCEPQGNSSSCKGGDSAPARAASLLSKPDDGAVRVHTGVYLSESDWMDNSDEWIAERLASAAAHQEEVMAYFDAHKERRQRFIVVDVEGWSPKEVMLPLRWVMRPKLEELPTDRLLVSRGQFARRLLDKADVPSKAQDALHAAPDTPSAVHANPRDHPKDSEETVNRALRKLVSCPESMWQDVLYAKCAAYIEGKGVVPAWYGERLW